MYTNWTGVRQGCLFSPFLFLLVDDWIVKTSTSKGNHGIQLTDQMQLNDLKFAGDTYTPANAAQDIQCSSSPRHIGPQSLQAKSKFLKCNTESPNHVTLDEEAQKVVAFA